MMIGTNATITINGETIPVTEWEIKINHNGGRSPFRKWRNRRRPEAKRWVFPRVEFWLPFEIVDTEFFVGLADG